MNRPPSEQREETFAVNRTDIGASRRVISRNMEGPPFPAIVGQEELKSALLLNAVNRDLGGVLIRGERGTGKSSAVRGLRRVLPEIRVVADCPFNCHPDDPDRQCEACRERTTPEVGQIPTPVVDLPLGATEDRIVGTLDVERAVTEGVQELDPGLLARANRGVLYVDEVNLLDDHLVDLLLDAAASGVNRVEREGLAVEHPAEFVLVGTMNPEEGRLRPQFLDRFGLRVDASAPTDPEARATIIEVAEAVDRNPEQVRDRYRDEERRLRERIVAARERYDDVTLGAEHRRKIAELCVAAGIEGNRGDIATARCARAMAALDGRTRVTETDLRRSAELALAHRVPDGPFGDDVDLDDLAGDQFGRPEAGSDGDDDDGDDEDGEPRNASEPSGRRRGGSESRQETGTSLAGRLRDFL
jgi:Mg-chelatase subunit ChlI